MEGKGLGIVVAILFACGIVWFQYAKKSDNSQELQDTAYAVLATAPDYTAHEDDYD